MSICFAVLFMRAPTADRGPRTMDLAVPGSLGPREPKEVQPVQLWRNELFDVVWTF